MNTFKVYYVVNIIQIKFTDQSLGIVPLLDKGKTTLVLSIEITTKFLYNILNSSLIILSLSSNVIFLLSAVSLAGRWLFFYQLRHVSIRKIMML